MRFCTTAMFALALAGCSHAEQTQAGGPPVSRAFAVGGFDKVALLGPDDVLVTAGPALAVRAEGDQEAVDRLDIGVVGGELRISRTKQGGTSRGKAKVLVTVPAIAAARLAGAGDLAIDRVAGAGFDASLSGAGNMTIGALEADRASFVLSGAGSIGAAGHVRTLALELSGAGEIDAGKLAANGLTASNRGTGRIRANAKTRAEVSLTGVGSVEVAGKPQCVVRRSGVGEVRCG